MASSKNLFETEIDNQMLDLDMKAILMMKLKQLRGN